MSVEVFTEFDSESIAERGLDDVIEEIETEIINEIINGMSPKLNIINEEEDNNSDDSVTHENYEENNRNDSSLSLNGSQTTSEDTRTISDHPQAYFIEDIYCDSNVPESNVTEISENESEVMARVPVQSVLPTASTEFAADVQKRPAKSVELSEIMEFSVEVSSH